MEWIEDFAAQHPFDFEQLHCRCGQCAGCGSCRSKAVYRDSTYQEQFHQYEYPGMHRMLLWAVRALFHYMPDQGNRELGLPMCP